MLCKIDETIYNKFYNFPNLQIHGMLSYYFIEEMSLNIKSGISSKFRYNLRPINVTDLI